MAVPADVLDRIAATVAALYREAETALARLTARHLAGDLDRDIPAPVWAERKLAAAGTLRRAAQVVVDRLQDDSDTAFRAAATEAYRAGDRSALAQLAAADVPDLDTALAEMPGFAAVEAMATAVHADLDEKARRITRDVDDAYREVITATTARVITGAVTRRQAAQAAWQRLTDRGITGFVDRSGRRWQLASYVEMATRTVAQRAAITGETDRLQASGVQLVVVSNAAQECVLCRPYEGRVLRLDPGPTGDITVPHQLTDQPVTVHVVDTLAAAQLAGLFHPNAILGNQQCRALGDVENAARAWYEGPSVHLTTARGHRLTVSPNHPVLTTAGWLAAERVREGMHVLSRPHGEREGLASDAAEDFHDAPASFEEVFDAVAAHGCRTSVAASGDDFHGDGRSYKGEVDVVWAKGALLNVLQPLGVEEFGEGGLVRTGVELESLAGPGPLLPCGRRVGGAVAGALTDLDAVGLETPTERRLADAEDVGEILAGLACGVTPDQVVNVERDWYRGHAYDLQTSTGAYLTADIVVHNCRHDLSAFLPGVTKLPSRPTADPEGDTARQRQRALERRIRRHKVAQVAALDPTARQAAGRRVRAAQADLRQHLAEHPALKRLSYRESIGAGNIPTTST